MHLCSSFIRGNGPAGGTEKNKASVLLCTILQMRRKGGKVSLPDSAGNTGVGSEPVLIRWECGLFWLNEGWFLPPFTIPVALSLKSPRFFFEIRENFFRRGDGKGRTGTVCPYRPGINDCPNEPFIPLMTGQRFCK